MRLTWEHVVALADEIVRERRGLPPIPEECSDVVTVTRFWTPVRESTVCREFDLAKEGARARGDQGAAGRDIPGPAALR
ncbi:hypothetical protein GCM10010341_43850 [Streptomyces noursei]|nr:hypothetical protein GCM10010341_43850 [Streptomyces noursei]